MGSEANALRHGQEDGTCVTLLLLVDGGYQEHKGMIGAVDLADAADVGFDSVLLHR